MANVRMLAIGTGRAGMVHATNFRWRTPRAELVAVVDADPERAALAAAELDLPGRGFTTLAAALAATPIDAVVITTPTFTHAALVQEAAGHGLHVLCEKPMALSLAECDAMMGACERASVTLQLAFMRRFDPPSSRRSATSRRGGSATWSWCGRSPAGPGCRRPGRTT
jgi:scyllo-inositol 2-dehydrogenase (NAD+)